MALIDGMLQELEQEAQTTRRVLERVPNDKLNWRPHEKSRTLGELALHIALVPGSVAEFVAAESPVQAPQFTDPVPKQASELVPALEESIAKAKKILSGMDDETLTCDLAHDAGGSRDARNSPSGNAAVDHVEPLVPSSRAVVGVSARTRHSDSLDLWPKCG